MEILTRFNDGKVISAHWSKDNGCLVIAESDGNTRAEIVIDPLGAESLRDYLNLRAKESDAR